MLAEEGLVETGSYFCKCWLGGGGVSDRKLFLQMLAVEGVVGTGSYFCKCG